MYKLLTSTILIALFFNSPAHAQTTTTQDVSLTKLQEAAKNYDPKPLIDFIKRTAEVLDRHLPKEGIFLTPTTRAKYDRVANGLASKKSAADKAAFVESVAASMIVNPTDESKPKIAPLHLYVVPDPLITSTPIAVLYGRYPTDLEPWGELIGVPECDEDLDNCDILQERQSNGAFFVPTRQGKVVTPRITFWSTINDLILTHEFGHFCQFMGTIEGSDPITAERLFDVDNIVLRHTEDFSDVDGWPPINKLLELELYHLATHMPEDPTPEQIGFASRSIENMFSDAKKLRKKLAATTDESTAKKIMKDGYKKGPTLKVRKKIDAIIDAISLMNLADALDKLAAEYEAITMTAGYYEFITINNAPRTQLLTLAESQFIDPRTGLIDENAIRRELTHELLKDIFRRNAEK